MTTTSIVHFELVVRFIDPLYEIIDPLNMDWCNCCDEKRSKWGCNNFQCCCPDELD